MKLNRDITVVINGAESERKRGEEAAAKARRVAKECEERFNREAMEKLEVKQIMMKVQSQPEIESKLLTLKGESQDPTISNKPVDLVVLEKLVDPISSEVTP